MAQPLNLSPPILPAPSAWMLTPSRGVTADYPGMTAVSTLANSLRPSGSSSPVAIAFTWLASPKPAARIRLMAHTPTLPSRAPSAPPERMDPPLSSRGRFRARPPSSSISPAPGTLHLFPSPLPPPRPSLLPPQLSHLPSLPLQEGSCIAPSLAGSHAIPVSPRLEMPWRTSGPTIGHSTFSALRPAPLTYRHMALRSALIVLMSTLPNPSMITARRANAVAAASPNSDPHPNSPLSPPHSPRLLPIYGP